MIAKTRKTDAGTDESTASDKRPFVVVSKTQAVRQYLLCHPDAKPVKVVSALKARGIEITPGHVSVIKFGLKAKTASPKKVAAPSAELVASDPDRAKFPEMETPEYRLISVADLLAANQLAKQLGGIEQAQRVIATLAKLTR